MNMTELKENKTYRRKSDGRFFKRDKTKFYAANDKGIWTETTEISLADVFEEKPVNFKKSLVDLYTEYKTGDINISNRAYDQMLQRLCVLGDELEKAKETNVTKKKVSKKVAKKKV